MSLSFNRNDQLQRSDIRAEGDTGSLISTKRINRSISGKSRNDTQKFAIGLLAFRASNQYSV